MVDVNTIIQSALNTLLVAIAGIIVTFLINLIKQGVSYINEKIDLIKDQKLKEYCKQMMQAAETMKDELLSGSDKKQWVTKKLVKFSKEKNISISEEAISNLIQSIFQELDGITLNTYKQKFTSSVESIDLESIINKAVDKALSEAK